MKIPEGVTPGRTAKLAGLGAELVALRAEGYTFASLKKILAANGVDASLEAIRRAILRQQAVDNKKSAAQWPAGQP